ncbi:MAG: hypothetical protein BEN19_04660 [Epulopiscium sp. Nuni2H_MBin003]|nr:MAG: hypothetical protein BEN19_04660 [Epulopiscium sp. Nuni2H_MBin003]
MKKNLYIGTFFLLLCLPVLLIPLKSNVSTAENRILAQSPAIITENRFNLNFFEDMDRYLEDNFVFRESLIGINAYIHEKIFKVSIEPTVIVGKNDWLFASSTEDDYNGKNLLSYKQIQQIIKTLELVDEYVNNQGGKFLFTIAPNKNSIYPENMPYKSDNTITNASRIKQEIRADMYVDLFEVLKNASETTYLARDSHWNNYGAYISYLQICEQLNIAYQNFSIIDHQMIKAYSADLNGMLYPINQNLDEQIYYTFDTTYDYTTRFRSMDDILISTISDTGSDSIVVFRDSFGNALLDYFGRQFDKVTFSRAVPYTIDIASDFDYMVLEIVERNVPNLLDNAPIMPAPIREFTGGGNVQSPIIYTEDATEYKHVFGYFTLSSTVNNIYIENDGILYEAFPILENKLEIQQSDNIIGFSAYLPSDVSNDYKIWIN